MAGIWETWFANGEDVPSVAIITTDANDTVSELHDRMPVILDRDEEDRWLKADDEEELEIILDPFPDERTRSYEVSNSVNSPANDKPQLVEPLGTDQSGIREFT